MIKDTDNKKEGFSMSSKMTVKKEAIMARFGGMGFHNSEANVWREMDDVQFNQGLSGAFARFFQNVGRLSGMDEGRDGRVRRIL